jgi:D-alanyl-D-alanine carboxypeptidase/D-alanyl-D-alanine-endopeptidase (penicillin-binding protein 4)
LRRLAAVLSVVLAFLAVAAAASGATLQTRISRALNSSGAASTSAIVLDLSTGKVVYARNPGLALRPASNQKLAVALSALEEIGPRYRIPTRVYGEGRQDGDVWRGRLVLKGYGDPTLARDDLTLLAREIKSRGIRFISGGIVADETFFDTKRMGPGWKPSYYKEECPPLSALIVGRGKQNGHIVDDPALMTAKAFRTELEKTGVDVVRGVTKAKVKGTAARLADVHSPKIMNIVKTMNLDSDNFYAEMLLKELGALHGTRGSSAAGAVVARRVLTGLGVQLAGVQLKDGSGLSRLDRWTARAVGSLLRTAWSQPVISSIFYASLPTAGISGTLADRMRRAPARSRVHAKTGTTMAASALSGYVKQKFVFSILQNGSPVSSTRARASQDRVGQILAGAAG